MGWLYGWNSKKSLINHLVEETPNMKCIASCYRGGIFSGVFWSVWEYKTDGEKVKQGFRWIRCDLLKCYNKEWGYKDMCESMHPFYYSCPPSYLNLAPVVECQEWRNKVLEKNQLKKWQNLQLKLLQIGDEVALKNCNIPKVRVTSIRPFTGEYLGRNYTIAKKFIDVGNGINLMKV